MLHAQAKLSKLLEKSVKDQREMMKKAFVAGIAEVDLHCPTILCDSKSKYQREYNRGAAIGIKIAKDAEKWATQAWNDSTDRAPFTDESLINAVGIAELCKLYEIDWEVCGEAFSEVYNLHYIRQWNALCED
jgi:hypothetical protein